MNRLRIINSLEDNALIIALLPWILWGWYQSGLIFSDIFFY